jgi:hypothetical protein
MPKFRQLQGLLVPANKLGSQTQLHKTKFVRARREGATESDTG